MLACVIETVLGEVEGVNLSSLCPQLLRLSFDLKPGLTLVLMALGAFYSS